MLNLDGFEKGFAIGAFTGAYRKFLDESKVLSSVEFEYYISEMDIDDMSVVADALWNLLEPEIIKIQSGIVIPENGYSYIDAFNLHVRIFEEAWAVVGKRLKADVPEDFEDYSDDEPDLDVGIWGE